MIEFEQENEASWVKLRMSVISPGLSYYELNRLDIFEFFEILAEVQRKKSKQDD